MTWPQLTPKARERFLSTYSADYFADCTLEYYKEDPDIKAKGFDIDEIFYTGFSCQGDGASWKGRVGLAQYIRHHWTDDATAVKREVMLALLGNDDMSGYINVNTRGHYSHSNTMYVQYSLEVYFNSTTTIDDPCLKDTLFFGASSQDILAAIGGEAFLEEVEEEVLSAAKELADEIYKALEEEYDYQHSEECVSELAEANGWKFDNEGNLI